MEPTAATKAACARTQEALVVAVVRDVVVARLVQVAQREVVSRVRQHAHRIRQLLRPMVHRSLGPCLWRDDDERKKDALARREQRRATAHDNGGRTKSRRSQPGCCVLFVLRTCRVSGMRRGFRWKSTARVRGSAALVSSRPNTVVYLRMDQQ